MLIRPRVQMFSHTNALGSLERPRWTHLVPSEVEALALRSVACCSGTCLCSRWPTRAQHSVIGTVKISLLAWVSLGTRGSGSVFCSTVALSFFQLHDEELSRARCCFRLLVCTGEHKPLKAERGGHHLGRLYGWKSGLDTVSTFLEHF